MIPIYIPSSGRASAAAILAGPLADIDVEAFKVTFVVPTGEFTNYTKALLEAGSYRNNVIDCPARGIAETRKWIGEYASHEGHSKFLMLDDDIRFLVRRSPEDWRLRGTKGDEFGELLQRIEEELEIHAHVGVSAREGNNRAGVGGPELANINTRTLRALAYRTDEFLAMEHGRVEVMEDFDVNLQLLRHGYTNCSLHYWAQGQKMTNAPGGCSQYRDHEVQHRSAHRLTDELHPGFARTRTKKNKTDAEGFGERTEVTVYWKKAFEKGRYDRS